MNPSLLLTNPCTYPFYFCRQDWSRQENDPTHHTSEDVREHRTKVKSRKGTNQGEGDNLSIIQLAGLGCNLDAFASSCPSLHENAIKLRKQQHVGINHKEQQNYEYQEYHTKLSQL